MGAGRGRGRAGGGNECPGAPPLNQPMSSRLQDIAQRCRAGGRTWRLLSRAYCRVPSHFFQDLASGSSLTRGSVYCCGLWLWWGGRRREQGGLGRRGAMRGRQLTQRVARAHAWQRGEICVQASAEGSAEARLLQAPHLAAARNKHDAGTACGRRRSLRCGAAACRSRLFRACRSRRLCCAARRRRRPRRMQGALQGRREGKRCKRVDGKVCFVPIHRWHALVQHQPRAAAVVVGVHGGMFGGQRGSARGCMCLLAPSAEHSCHLVVMQHTPPFNRLTC